MKILFHRDFDKQFHKLSAKQKKKVSEKLSLFVLDCYHPSLNNHPLKGPYKDCRSINIRGDLRMIYHVTDKQEILFIAIGTHSELYQ